jgi:hypothetical protein
MITVLQQHNILYYKIIPFILKILVLLINFYIEMHYFFLIVIKIIKFE